MKQARAKHNLFEGCKIEDLCPQRFITGGNVSYLPTAERLMSSSITYVRCNSTEGLNASSGQIIRGDSRV